MIDTAKIAGAEQQAELARLKRELSLAENRLQEIKQQNTALRNDNDDLSQKLLVRAKRNGDSSVLMDRLTDMRAQLRDSERLRDKQQEEAAGLKIDLDQAQAELARIGSITSDDSEEVKALQQQLEELRRQSRQQLADLQRELDAALSDSANAPDSSLHVLEVEALRQENSGLNQTLSDRLKELQNSQETGQLLEDELEDANTEIDELRRQLEKRSEKISELEQNLKQPATRVAELLEDDDTRSNSFIPGSIPVLKADGQGFGGYPLKLIGLSLFAGFLLGLAMMSLISPDDTAVPEPRQAPVKAPAGKVQVPSSGQILRPAE